MLVSDDDRQQARTERTFYAISVKFLLGKNPINVVLTFESDSVASEQLIQKHTSLKENFEKKDGSFR